MSMTAVAIILMAGLLLAYANGANDNFKGVATLFGSGTTNFQSALAWATGTTLLGSLCAVFLAYELVERFNGKGLVPSELSADPNFVAAVAMAAATTVLLATRLGMPISTTHALVGALAGTAVASASTIQWTGLATIFFAPLILSPLVALIGTSALYPVFRRVRITLGVTKQTCFCAGVETVDAVSLLSPALAAARAEQLTATLGSPVTCQERYSGRLLGVNCGQLLNGMHYASAGLVSFARGLNDTPKIAALLLVGTRLNSFTTLAVCGVAIAAGGIFGARRVAETMSHRITTMSAGQGATANLLTGLIVIVASRWGLPVFTTHVSCGSLFGVGMVTRQGRWGLIGKILLAWITTLPAASTVRACQW